nr:Ger(x)C family spore germination protein [Desulfitobacterium hafniense]
MKRGVGQRLLKFSFVIIVLLPMVTGCWGKREVEQLGFVIAMGVDAGEKPGRYKITYQIAMPQNGTDGGELKDWTMTVEGSSIRQSEEHVYEVLNKQPFVGSTKVIVIGEGAAKEGINKVLDFFQRFYEFRRTAYLFLGKGTAEEILNTKRKTGSIPGLNILAQMEQNEAVSTVPSFRLGHFLTVNATPGYDAMLPVLEILEPGEHEMEYKGNMKQVALHTSGVFRGDELAGYLTEQETKGTLWINGEVEKQFISTEEHEDKKIFCAGKVTGSSSNYKLVDSEGRLGIDLKVQ